MYFYLSDELGEQVLLDDLPFGDDLQRRQESRENMPELLWLYLTIYTLPNLPLPMHF